MVTAEQVEQWRGRSVLDPEGAGPGKLEEIYYAANGEPVFVQIRSGLLGRHHAIVPLAGSSVTRDYLRVAFPRADIEAAGDAEVADTLDAASAAAIASSYGVAVPTSESGYESSARLEARRVAALAAQQQADALLADADRLGGKAASARADALEADASASHAELDAAAAAARADAARRDAEAAAREAVPPPSER